MECHAYNVPGIKGGIEGAEARFATQALFDLTHQREEVRQVTLVKGLGEFGQHEFAPVGNFGDNNARAIAPLVFTDLNGVGRDWIVSRSHPLIVATLTAEFAIGITRGLFIFIEAVGDIGFRIVLFDPGDDVLGIQRDTFNWGGSPVRQLGPNQVNAIGQQKLQGRIGQVAQHLSEMPRGRQTGPGIETQRMIGGRD